MSLKRIQPAILSSNDKNNMDAGFTAALAMLNEYINVYCINPDVQNASSRLTEERQLQLNNNVIWSIRNIAYQLLDSRSEEAKNSLRDVYEFIPIHLEYLEPADLIFVATNILEAAFIYREVA